MAFAGHCGIALEIGEARKGKTPVQFLFNEELGAVLQIKRGDLRRVREAFGSAGLNDACLEIGGVDHGNTARILDGGRTLFEASRTALHRAWSETTYHMQRLRDHPECAQHEYDRLLDADDPGLQPRLTFDPAEDIAAPYVARSVRPRVAVLREQGINGQVEMAAAFDRAGFDAVDVHMTDIITGRVGLREFKGYVACGGFSYGDVLGAGEGWAKSILFNPRAREEFEAFFRRTDSFALGVCNG
jgi:phosphoribosylformylglycinamidine synthase